MTQKIGIQVRPLLQATNPEKFKQYDWVLQEYISNPWLVNGKKMHLRQIMVYQPGDKPSYYMYMGEFALADKPYIKGDWSNKGIHDTHFKNGIGFEWPFEMNFTMDQWRYVMGQFDYIYACILYIMKGKGECYSDSKNCFELLGLDFMITDDLRVILIEVNARMGLSPSPWFTNIILVSLLKYVIDDYPVVKSIEFGLDKDFATFKNNLKNHCTKDYIFFIDADEYPTEHLLKLLKQVITANSGVECFALPRINTVKGLTSEHINKWGWFINDKGWINYPDYQTRICKNTPEIKWTGKVH
jgi:hypothetical protein